MASQPIQQQRTFLPHEGLIEGGLLHGWAYAFIRLVDERKTMQVVMEAWCTPPAWPFPSPRRVRLVMWTDFDKLVVHPKAKLVREQPVMLDFEKLLAAAVKLALELDPDPAAREMGRKTPNPS